MKNGIILPLAIFLFFPITAGAAGRAEAPPRSSVTPQQPATLQPAPEREPAPPPSLSLSGGIDAALARDRRIGGALDAAMVLGNFGVALGGDIVSLNLTSKAPGAAVGGFGFLSFRYYARATSLVGNYLAAFFVGAGAGYGIVGYEDSFSGMGDLYYVDLCPFVPFGGELGMQAVFANHLLVQSLVRLGGAAFMADTFGGMYPLISVTLSVGMLVE